MAASRVTRRSTLRSPHVGRRARSASAAAARSASLDLPKHPVVGGHPVHAALSDGPVVLIPLAVLTEILERGRLLEDGRVGDLVTSSAAAASIAAVTVGWI